MPFFFYYMLNPDIVKKKKTETWQQIESAIQLLWIIDGCVMSPVFTTGGTQNK